MLSGIIVIWSGSIATIPTGWVLCDGLNGTPNLQNRFVIGAGDTYSVDDQGGAPIHVHSFTGDGHSHVITPAGNITAGAAFSDTVSTENVTGDTDLASSLPPYYALAYIMKT